jgi:hypothetical protein
MRIGLLGNALAEDLSDGEDDCARQTGDAVVIASESARRGADR